MEKTASVPFAPVPVGIVDGSLDSTEVDHWSEETELLHDERNRVNKSTTDTWFKSNDLIMALCYAAGSGQIDTIEILLSESHGRVNVDDSNKTGRTPLHWAARNSQTDACRFLVTKGANVHHTTPDGVNTLAWAVWGGCLETVKWAIDCGIDPFAQNRWGCGLIHWASAGGDVELCYYLKNEIGLDFGMKNNQGHNGLAKAAWNNHRPLCEFFLFQHTQEYIDLRRKQNLEEGIDISISRIHNDAKIQGMLMEVDRAGLMAYEIAKINGNTDLSCWLQTLMKSTTNSNKTNNDSFVAAIIPKAFQIYYQSQNILGSIHLEEDDNMNTHERAKQNWNKFISILATDQPVGLSPINLPASWAGLTMAVQQWLDSLGLERAKTGVSIIDKKEWLQNPKLKSQCDILEKAGLLLLDLRGMMEKHVINSLLKIKPDHLVMCIKTSAIGLSISTLQSKILQLTHTNCSGAIVINDPDSKNLISETSTIRNRGSSSGTIITVTSSVKFPCLFEENDAQLLFDRVLVQPECSQDGDMRLMPHRWSEWKMETGIRTHATNLKLLLRGLHQLNQGGRLIYTTRSLNPIENEAVVLAALHRYKGVVSLVECEELEGKAFPDTSTLLRAEGMTTWLVPDVTMLEGKSLFRFLEHWEEVPDSDRSPVGPLRRTMFSSQTQDDQGETNEAINRRLELKRCVRFTPLHNEHSHCFFVAVFTKDAHKAAEISDWKVLKPNRGDDESQMRESFGNYVRRQRPPKFDKTYTPLPIDSWTSIAQFYGIDNGENLYLEHSTQALYDLADNHSSQLRDENDEDEFSLSALSICMLSRGAYRLYKQLRQAKRTSIHTSGIRLFEPMNKLLQGCTCRWRPAQQGLTYLAPLCSQRIVRLNWLVTDEASGNLPRMHKLLKKLFKNGILDLSRDAKELEAAIQSKCCPGGIILGVQQGDDKTVGQVAVNEEGYLGNNAVVFWLACVLTSTSLLLHTDSHTIKAISTLFSSASSS